MFQGSRLHCHDYLTSRYSASVRWSASPIFILIFEICSMGGKAVASIQRPFTWPVACWSKSYARSKEPFRLSSLVLGMNAMGVWYLAERGVSLLAPGVAAIQIVFVVHVLFSPHFWCPDSRHRRMSAPASPLFPCSVGYCSVLSA